MEMGSKMAVTWNNVNCHFCLHKRAWKLIESLDGANASAIIYSITETAKANELSPFRYSEYNLVEFDLTQVEIVSGEDI